MQEFRPYVPALRSIYSNMQSGDREPSQTVQDFILKVDGRIVDSLDARNLLYEIRGRQKMGAWHFHSAMWELLLPLHFTKKERIAFYCHYLRYENGSGFTEASEFYFKKPPNQLDTDELATIVAIGRAPKINSPSLHPDRLQAAKRSILEGYAGAH
jgi:Transglycosylase